MSSDDSAFSWKDAEKDLMAGIDTSVPHSARIWNYWLGGKNNYPVDREAGDQYRQVYPQIVEAARASRYFLHRAVRYLAGEIGIRQFLDIGTGLPTVDNTHEVAQQVAPESRVVYVDNDPLVLTHARALLTSTPQGATDYIDADMRDTDKVMREAARTLNFDEPIALTLMGVMGHIPGEEAYSLVDRLIARLPSGSYFALCEALNTDEAFNEAQRTYNESGAVPYHLRSAEEIARFFDGLELVDPGLVMINQWRPEPSPFDIPEVDGLGGVARKE
jgi:O-methyltransferase involved in polyketide biosynthesis